MIQRKEKNKLFGKHVSTEIQNLRTRILLERLKECNNHPDDITIELMQHISDQEILNALTLDNAKYVLPNYANYIDKFDDFMNELYNMDVKYERCIIYLNPYKLHKYYGHNPDNIRSMKLLIAHYIAAKKVVPTPILVAYVNCMIKGRWFFSRYSCILDFFNVLLEELVSILDKPKEDDSWEVYVLPTMLEFLPYKYTLTSPKISYSYYYSIGGKFIDNGTGMKGILTYLEVYDKCDRIDELPDEFTGIVRASIHKNDEALLEEYKNYILNSIARNGNNIKLLTWGNELPMETIKEISEVIVKADSPLTNFYYYHSYYVTTTLAYQSTVYNTEFIINLIRHGLDYSTLQPWVNCLYFIEDAMDMTSKENLELYMDSIFDSPIATGIKWEEIELRNMNDYIIQKIMPRMSQNWIYNVLQPVVFNNKNIFESLSPTSVKLLTKNMDITTLVKYHPKLAGFQSIYKTLKFSTIEELIKINDKVLQYIPFHLIPTSLLIQIVSYQKRYIPMYYKNELFRMSAGTVVEMLNNASGYGYILDLPTTLQINAVVSYIETKS